MAAKPVVKYENNPFMIGIEGLKLLFRQAKSTGIYAVIMCTSTLIVSFLLSVAAFVIDVINGEQASNYTYTSGETISATTALVVSVAVVIGLLIYIGICVLLFGPLEYAAAQTAKGKDVSLKEGFSATVRTYPAYFGMYLLFFIKVFLWSLLFIVPGIIMFNKYILAGTVFFAEGKRGNAAIKRSIELTNGAWLTTYGGAWTWNILSQGLATCVFWPGQMAVLYRQFKATTDANTPKPPAHIISWLTLLLPIGLSLLYMLFVLSLVLIVLTTGTTAP